MSGPADVGALGDGSGRPSRIVVVAGMASLLDSAAIVSVGSALPLWRSAFALDDWRVGVVSSAMTIGIAVGALGGGRIADKHGRQRIFSLTVGLYALGAALVASAGNETHLVLGVVVLGLASGADLPASIALVADRVAPRVRGRMVALTHVMWTIGIVVATALAFAVSPFGLAGMRGVFGLLAAGALLTLAGRRRALSRSNGEVLSGDEEVVRPPALPTAVNRRLHRKRLLLIAAFYVLYTLVANTFGSFRTYLLVVVAGADQTTATAIAFGVTVLGLGGTVVFSRIADSPWRRRVYPFAGILLVASQVTLASSGAGSVSAVLVALVLYTVAYPYVGEGLYKVWAQESASPDLRATFQGATIAAARATAALFALATPSLMAQEPALLFWLLTFFAAVAAAIGTLVTRIVARAGARSP